MEGGRWAVVDSVLGAALERPPHERAAFVQHACADDEELRRDVESLLSHVRDAGDFLERPARELLDNVAASGRGSLPNVFGPYRILELLGRGGMGEVYRARDDRLKRDVALKVLPSSLAADPDRLARFQREAEILASLNHPHIAAIYGVEERTGLRALVLELVDGDTLGDRIARGPLPTRETLAIARQVADALDAAHERGIIHRDLKPSNIKVTPQGQVKVLDFGLAKLARDSPPPATETAANGRRDDNPSITRQGTILGTAAYMSPEQACGQPIDRRTDVWAFGAVLYEMLAGRRAFPGEDVQQTLGAILSRDPDWSALAADTPGRTRRLLELCLDKDVGRRVRDMATVRLIMDGAFETAGQEQPRGLTRRKALGSRWALSWGVGLATALIAVLAAAWSLRPVELRRVSRYVLPVDTRVRFNPSVPAISPNGEYVAYAWGPAGDRTVSLHRMSDPEGAPLAEFDGASYPFFSPDSAWLAFFAGGELRKASVLGGPPTVLARATASRGGSWGDDNRIVFAPSFRSALARVSSDGGALEMLTSLDTQLDESGHRLPHVLPGSRAVIFTAVRTRGPAIIVASMETGERRLIIEGAVFARYVSTGHLVYVQEGRLMAAPFDVRRLTAVGPAIPVLDIGSTADDSAAFEVTDAGFLAYRSGSAGASTLVWVDRAGMVTPFARPLRGFMNPRVSPDGQRIVASREDDLWVYDVPRDVLSQLTFQGGNLPLWTREGRDVIYGRPRTGTGWDIFRKPADGSGSEQELVARPLDQVPSGGNPSSDGQLLPFAEWSLDAAADIHLLSLKDGGERVFMKSPQFELNASFSPDAQYVAYLSTELGTPEVFIRPVVGEGGVRRVSLEGGVEPHWSANGELFFRDGNQVLAVDVRTQPNLVVGEPRTLFEGRYVLSSMWDRNYDVTADGQRFLMVRQADAGDSTVRLNIVVNWLEELKEKTR